MYKKVFILVVAVMFMCVNAFAMCGMCDVDMKEKSCEIGDSAFSCVAKEAVMNEGVKNITYDQFMNIRNSGEKYVLLDVLSAESFKEGHIEGAVSFPLEEINEATSKEKLSKADGIIVYCGSFQCRASTNAAKKLQSLGYNVLDYKGGLKEWQEKGNKLVK